ncbi:MAG: NAD(P)-dependent oxidoreductase [Acholeplasmataceae bacterium]|nr:NAD(P)-dependent oxidoreductase [Acholeplasmataceae bacterium]
MRILFIGVGVMGKPMAGHLSRAGHEVTAYNRTFAKAKALEPDIKACDDLKACSKDKDVIISIVGYPKDVKDVYETVFASADQGTVLIDMTTSSPKLAVELYDAAKKHGMSMLDAPVTGGDLGAINGTLSIMVGGDEAVYESVLPLLETMGKTVTYMGKAGNGQHMKLANQTVIAGNIAGIAEALMYASDKGLDHERMLSVITGGSASSWQAANNGPKMVAQDYRPGFFVKHYLKDLMLACEEKGDRALPVLTYVKDVFETLSSQGYNDFGTQSIIDYYLKKLA